MERYEELLEKMERTGCLVSHEAIYNEIGRISSENQRLICDLEAASTFEMRKKIMDKLMDNSKRMHDLDSLSKARTLYDLKHIEKSFWDRVKSLLK